MTTLLGTGLRAHTGELIRASSQPHQGTVIAPQSQMSLENVKFKCQAMEIHPPLSLSSFSNSDMHRSSLDRAGWHPYAADPAVFPKSHWTVLSKHLSGHLLEHTGVKCSSKAIRQRKYPGSLNENSFNQHSSAPTVQPQ